MLNKKTKVAKPPKFVVLNMTSTSYLLLRKLSNELAIILLNVYDSWGKLGTMSVIFRTGIISVLCKNMIKMILKAAYPYTRILKNQLQKELDSIIGESESAAVKN